MAIANARQIRLADQAAQAGEVLMIKSLQDMCRIRRSFSPIEIDDYELQTPGSSSPMLLSEFLDYRARLLVIHNMGDACAHCAVYADGLNGVLPHLESIAEVLLVAPMSPEALGEFAASRSWRFALASTLGTSLASDLGFEGAPGEPLPGVFVVERSGVRLVVSARYVFNPGDHFSPVWPMLNLAGINLDGEDWQPKLSYS
jgi:predicted dithiol-disulfide oxidoreductase (DUF899 family)